MKFAISFASALAAVSLLSAWRTMQRPEVRETRLGFHEAPLDRWMKRWLMIFPMGFVINLINPINWILAGLFAGCVTGLRAMI